MVKVTVTDIEGNKHLLQLDADQQKSIVDIAEEIHHLRSIKSPAEIAKIRKACDITSDGFDLLPTHAKVGQTEREICTQMRINMLSKGADFVKYLISGSGLDGYGSIIMGPTSRRIDEVMC